MAGRRGVTRAAKARIVRDEKAGLKAVSTNDSFQNFAARVGIGTDNVSSAGTYGFNPISRLQVLLEWMYRGSWIVGKAVDSIAEDMTKAGVSYTGEDDPAVGEALDKALTKFQLWNRVNATVKWSRLYGGAICVAMIDGQDPTTPLRVSSVGVGQLQGFLVMDRWMVQPSLQDLVTDLKDPALGLPRFYEVVADAPALPRMRVHHSRVVRMVGIELPYWQKIAENLWGMSIVERLYDRLLAFDSATQGASQLMYRAHLRTMKIPQLRDILAAGGPALEGLLAQVQFIRRFQSSEGITMIDGADEMEMSEYGFSGISDTILQFGQQLSGSLDIPLVRLFGQSPGGLNSTGESDLRTYYDGIEQRQESTLRLPLDAILRVVARSEGIKLSPGFGFQFNPLWQLTDEQKAETASKITTTVLDAESSGVVSPAVALRELKQQSRLTGVWTNVSNEDIEAAEAQPAPGAVEELLGGLAAPVLPGLPAAGEPAADPAGGDVVPFPRRRSAASGSRDSMPVRTYRGLPIIIEQGRGERRTGNGWVVVMPADYGFVRGTGSAEGAMEQMDCFVGPADTDDVWIIDQLADDRSFDEHKVMLGFASEAEACQCYTLAHSDVRWDRIGGVKHMTVSELRKWLRSGDVTKPLASPGASRAASA